MAETHQAPPPIITLLPSPGMGHLIPLAEFAKRLIQYHNFSVTFIFPTDGPISSAQKTVLDSLPKSINSIFLPPVNFDDLPEDVKVETRISLTVTRSLPSIQEAFKVLTATNRVSALVVDLFGTDAFDVAREFNVSPYIFYPTTAMCLSLFLHLPKLDEMYSCEYREIPEPLQFPGCVPIHGGELLDPTQDRKNDAYKWLLHNCKRYRMAEGIFVNTFVGLESSAIKALKDGLYPTIPPVYPVGPLIQNGSRESAGESECLKWLDDQPSGSVVFISFGSGGALSLEQLTELALGLELSEQKFLWVVRSPTQTAAATYFTAKSISDPMAFLPKGFLERTKGQGLVVPSWAPQIQVLSHGSTGGFLTHCGWNSTLESVVQGVPLIAWPLYAEQKMNAKMLVDGLKVALRPKSAEDGIINRTEIATVVKNLMEGEEGKMIRNRMRVLKEAASMVLSEDGSSTKSLSEVASKWNAKVSST
ncbi:hydroquinone glucosyltransferase-like [Macadamia integrifolia]|uniref:hydroquinone glucosyltransferase-like n=1 Tax=Macadamia integrifolia TaxID=60698 RepID=UPI001C4F9849|nr:hydroquinone glucosyltransferase-like [Macadamia integrifolia]